MGYEFEAVFDIEAKTLSDSNLKVRDVNDLPEFLANNKIDIGIIATPKQAAQEVADILCKGGVKGIWNFSPVDLKVSNGAVIESVHLDESLFTLTYFMNSPEDFIF